MADNNRRDVIVIGGGLAGLSAGVYLGRSRRDALLIHSDRSMAKWEDDVQNYLGFPEGIAGQAIPGSWPATSRTVWSGDRSGWANA